MPETHTGITYESVASKVPPSLDTKKQCFILGGFGHRPKCFWNDRKKISYFGQNVW